MAMTELQELESDLARVEELIERGDEFVAEGYPMAAEFNEMNRITRDNIVRKIEQLKGDT